MEQIFIGTILFIGGGASLIATEGRATWQWFPFSIGAILLLASATP
jgi:hypothetical protein